jgi:hypothetical protein
MALFKMGMFMTDLSGAIGGLVASRTRGGSAIRRKGIPTNPQTTFQQSVRSLLTSLSQQWRSLTQDQISAWNSAVQNFQRSNRLGELKSPTGKNLYVAFNTNLYNSGSAGISVPPLPAEQFIIDGLALSVDTAVPEFEITAATTGTGTDFVHVWVTPMLSAGVSNPNGQYRFLGSFAGAAVFSQNVLVDYTARFGAPIVGQKVFVKLVPVTPTGQAGVGQVVSAIVV